jgi:predicted nucleic acid-binding protein
VKIAVVDASALAAVVFNEPRSAEVADRLQGCRVHAPHLLRFEMANIARKKIRRCPDRAVLIAEALTDALRDDAGISWAAVDEVDALLIGVATGLTAYDASYLWLAGLLGADLVTLDPRLAAALASV